jgi:hypothetical protein
MIYVWGSRLYGKVDNVKGLFHVATKFGHFDYFPLIPMGSWVITEQTGSGWRGVPIPVSLKSIVVGLLRALSVPGLLVGTAMLAMAFDSRKPSVESLVAASAVIAISLFFLVGCRYVPGLGKATPRRAEELGRLLGLRQEVLDALRRNQYNLPPTSGFEVLAAAPAVQEVAAERA